MWEEYICRDLAKEYLIEVISSVSPEDVRLWLEESGDDVPSEQVTKVFANVVNKARVTLDE